MELKRLQELAGITESDDFKLQLNIASKQLAAIGKYIFTHAEKLAYDDAKEAKQAITGDAIHKHAESLVKHMNKAVMDNVEKLIEKEYGKEKQ